MACVAPTVATHLAAPDRYEGPGVAIRAPPSQNVAIRRLDDGEDVTGALVGHFDVLVVGLVSSQISYTLRTRDSVTYRTKQHRGTGCVDHRVSSPVNGIGRQKNKVTETRKISKEKNLACGSCGWLKPWKTVVEGLGE